MVMVAGNNWRDTLVSMECYEKSILETNNSTKDNILKEGANEAADDIRISAVITDSTTEIPRDPGPFSEFRSPARTSYSKVVRHGNRDEQHAYIDLELRQVFTRRPSKIHDEKQTPEATNLSLKSYKSEDRSDEERKSPKSLSIVISGKNENGGRRRKGSQKWSSANSLLSVRPAIIITAKYGLLKICFDDVSEPPASTSPVPESVDSCVQKSSLLPQNPEHFIPPKCFPKSSVLYTMYSKPKQSSSEVPSPPRFSSLFKTEMVPNSPTQDGKFPLIHKIPPTSVLHQISSTLPNSAASDCTLPVTTGNQSNMKTPEAAIKDAFSAHFARCQSQLNIKNQISTKIPSKIPSPVRDKFPNPQDYLASSSDSGAYRRHDCRTAEKNYSFSILKSAAATNSISESSKMTRFSTTDSHGTSESYSGNAAEFKCKATIKTKFDDSELPAMKKLMKYTLFGEKFSTCWKAQMTDEKNETSKKDEANRCGFHNKRSLE